MSKPSLVYDVPLADGTAKRVKLNWRAWSEAEGPLNEENLVQRIQENGRSVFTFRRIHAILWAGQHVNGGTLTFDQVGDLLDGTKMGEYANVIMRGFYEFSSGKSYEALLKERAEKAAEVEDARPLDPSPVPPPQTSG